MKRRSRARKVGLIFLIVIPVIFLVGWIVMLLWNNILPGVIHVNAITYWQALGLLVLSKILFGGFRGGPGRRMMRGRMQERWQNMTDEERVQFKNEWRGRCGGWGKEASAEPGKEQTSV